MTEIEAKGIRLAELCCELRRLYQEWDEHTTEYGKRRREIEQETAQLAKDVVEMSRRERGKED